MIACAPLRGIGLAALLLAASGCIGLDFSRDTVAPQPGQWEYRTVRTDQTVVSLTSTSIGAQTEPDLARLGAEGWELVAVHDGAYILKRPKATK